MASCTDCESTFGTVILVAVALLLVTGWLEGEPLLGAEPEGVPVLTEPEGVPVLTEPEGVPVLTEPEGVPVLTEPEGVPVLTEPEGVPGWPVEVVTPQELITALSAIASSARCIARDRRRVITFTSFYPSRS